MSFSIHVACYVITKQILTNKLFFMKTEKMSLNNVKNVLSRAEMKTIMAGSHGGACYGTAGLWYGPCAPNIITEYCSFGGYCF